MIIAGLKALAHEGRLRLLSDIIAAGHDGITAGALAEAHDLNFTTASAQLTALSQANLVNATREARNVIYRPNDMQISELLGFLMRDVCQNRDEILSPLSEQTGYQF